MSVRAFRGAVAQNIPDPLFHNHQSDGGLSYRYPRVQYKKLARRLCVVCLGPAAEKAGLFFGAQHWQITAEGNPTHAQLIDLKAQMHRVVVWQENTQEYTLSQWAPFSQVSHAQHQELRGLVARQTHLQTLLLKHIMAFLRSVEAVPSRRIEVELLDMSQPQPKSLHGYRGVVFERLSFATNVSLPQFIGLGRHSAVGFGVLRRVRREEEQD